ncbi:MAG: restriction endonuclease subunit S [Treponema sp.]|nr:restriction endonuclease subunit S [Treponema sp.]
MEEWKEYKLSGIMDLIGGGTPKTSNPDFWDGDIPWISVKDFNGERRYVGETEKKITQAGLENSSTKILSKGDIIISARGTVGELAIIPSDMAFNQSCYGLRAKDFVDSTFLYYLLKQSVNILKHNTHGSVFDTITRDTFDSIDVSLPPLPTQQKIAAILSSLDDKIELNNKINENLEQQAQALFKSWFVDFEPFGGKMPEGWKVGKLSDILCLKKNPIQPGEDTSLPYLPIDLIPIKSLAIREVRPNEEALSSLLRFDENDILIGAMRVYFHRVAIAPFDGITRTTCFVLEPIKPKYFAYAAITCNQDLAIDYAQKTSKGSTMPYAVWEGGLGDFEIPIPDEATAENFNNIVKPLLEQIKKSYFENKTLQELRESLLPKLMNKQIKV